MKQLKKLLFISVSLVLACFMLTGCGGTTSAEEEIKNKAAIEAADLKSVETYTEQQFAQQLVAADYDNFQQRVDAGEVVISRTFDNDLAQRWKTFNEKHGKITAAEINETNRTDDGYTCKMILTGEDNVQMALTITYNKSCYPMSTMLEDYSDDAAKTTGTRMAEAGSNIIVGLGVVFCVLIFLTLVISLFKYIGKRETDKQKAEDNAARAAARKTAPAPAAVPASAEVPLQDNGALVAVITAAIAASEGPAASPNGYVVRSIRRLNSNKWR